MEQVNLSNRWSEYETKSLFFAVVKHGQRWKSIMRDEEFGRIFQLKNEHSLETKWSSIKRAQDNHERKGKAGPYPALKKIALEAPLPDIGPDVGVAEGWTDEDNDAFATATAAHGIKYRLCKANPLIALKTFEEWEDKVQCFYHDLPGAKRALKLLELILAAQVAQQVAQAQVAEAVAELPAVEGDHVEVPVAEVAQAQVVGAVAEVPVPALEGAQVEVHVADAPAPPPKKRKRSKKALLQTGSYSRGSADNF